MNENFADLFLSISDFLSFSGEELFNFVTEKVLKIYDILEREGVMRIDDTILCPSDAKVIAEGLNCKPIHEIYDTYSRISVDERKKIYLMYLEKWNEKEIGIFKIYPFMLSKEGESSNTLSCLCKRFIEPVRFSSFKIYLVPSITLYSEQFIHGLERRFSVSLYLFVRSEEVGFTFGNPLRVYSSPFKILNKNEIVKDFPSTIEIPAGYCEHLLLDSYVCKIIAELIDVFNKIVRGEIL